MNETTPTDVNSNVAPASGVSNLLTEALNPASSIGSPLKKQRPSVDDVALDRSAGFPSAIGDVLGRATAEHLTKEAPSTSSGAVVGPKDEDDDEL